MESTPLVLAHTHARNASAETHKANPVAASEEHDLAAGEFANAANFTSDAEALRTLKLLEQHHQKLAELLKFRPETAQPARPTITSSSPSPQSPQPSSPPSPKTLESSPRHVSLHASPLLHPPHQLSSSIASNLASARGIPSNRQRRGPQIPTATLSPHVAEGRLVNPQTRSRLSAHENRTEETLEDIPPSAVRPSALSPSRAQISSPDITPTSPARQPSIPPPPAADYSFSRFYATFAPLLSKLSAPLAFAGLPLNPSEPTAPSTSTSPTEKPPKPSQTRDLDPNLTRLFSQAALRAVREENGLPPTAESFYVVPTTGGTMSYAGMLSHTKHAHSPLPAVDEDELFVDASETPHADQHGHPHSRQQNLRSRRIAGKAVNSKGKTLEELTVENEALKNVAIDLGDRLRAFEMGAQRSSMALHMSMRAMQSPTASAAIGRVGGVDAKAAIGGEGSSAGVSEQEARIRELEEELRSTRKEMKRLVRENQKLQGVVDRYRERWEILKDGARERMKGT
ncbi:hypothetical protein MMC30_001922 [Trapelia coarctata]|nr:hypothetical protein [Trapelia coarctata]